MKPKPGELQKVWREWKFFFLVAGIVCRSKLGMARPLPKPQPTRWWLYGDPVEELFALWRCEATALHPGASEQDLDRFELSLKLKLPGDFRKPYRLANGMPEDASDFRLVRLWPLEQIERDRSRFVGSRSDAAYVTFSDGMLDAVFYSLRICEDGSASVVVLDGEPLQDTFIADSISGFASQYLTRGLPGLLNE